MSNLQEQLQTIKNQENSYNKQFKTFDEQLQILKQRKLNMTNDSFVLSKLQRINYYRLSAYFYHFNIKKMEIRKMSF